MGMRQALLGYLYIVKTALEILVAIGLVLKQVTLV